MYALPGACARFTTKERIMIGTINAGFTIIAAIPTASIATEGDYVVTGVRTYRDHVEYVTWRTHTDRPDGITTEPLWYYSGHYFRGTDARREAMRNMIERADERMLDASKENAR
jgi:hypothetical protein